MSRRYGNKARTVADKKKAGLALAYGSSRPLDEIEAMLVRSYAYPPAEAARIVEGVKAQRGRG